MRITIQFSIATSFILCALQPVYAAECIAKSGAQTVPLLELYTSEGCSSCPPADKWLSGIKAGNLTPLAFHVDYWDYIGWKDKFSKSEYSDRQRKTAAYAGAGFVYTPQFVINGRDFKGWDNSRLKDASEKSLKLAARANLSLSLEPQPNNEMTLKTTANTTKADDLKYADVFVALYENKLVSQVSAGENNGTTLKHDYVVRELFGAYQINNQNVFSKNFTLKPEWKNRQGGAVIFVQDSRNGEILQSLQLPFCS